MVFNDWFDRNKVKEDPMKKDKIKPDKKNKSNNDGKHIHKALGPKEKATSEGEPWVSVISVEIDENNIGNGAFELDWNEIFVARLVKAGFTGKTDIDIVDQWFKTVCQNVVMEHFEQEMADPEKRQRHQYLGE